MTMLAKIESTCPEIAEARRVLIQEADAIYALAESLGASFSKAIEMLVSVEGRVVVTGIGKSGHVARKIVATFASTGTPALFVHPAEASHGDLGMITRQDAVLALSNSGETDELANIVRYSRRFDIPLIGITSRENSSLAEASDVALVLPCAEEACPIGLAPTTSTTLAMALGDAIATTLLTKRKFSPDDFSVFHPGGALGRKLLTIEEIMHTGDELPLAPLETSMSEAILIMTSKGFGCLGLTDTSGYLAGVITDGDLRRHMQDDLLALPAQDVMTPDPRSIRAGALVQEGLLQLNQKKITSLFVHGEEPKDGKFKPVGIIHVHDCLRAG